MTENKANDSIREYVKNMKPIGNSKEHFINNCKTTTTRISTGWLGLDKALNGGLANELYIMGAETSTGKSAFMMNLAQNIATQGINVLYFSLEMGAEEFIARAISKLSFVANTKDKNKRKVTAGDVLYWSYDEQRGNFMKLSYSAYSEYADEYFKTYGDHLYIIEAGLNGFCAKDMANIATLFKKEHPDEQVVVFVDYLQIIKADPDDRSQADRKTKTDVSVVTLKTLASQIGMPVLTVSSVSRSNYNDKISTASFKESGDTEYTGGVLIGWNWHGVTDCADKEAIETEKKLSAERGYRKMIFDVLKYRNSQRDHGTKLLYYPAYNYFVDENDWHLDVDGKNPFVTWDETETTKKRYKSDRKSY